MKKQLDELFKPITIGSLHVKNRVVIPPMGVGFGADEEGHPTEQLIEFLVERAKSEPGIIITGASYVHPSGTTNPSSPMKAIHLWDDKVIPSLRTLTDSIHIYDVKIGAQLNHGGMTYLPGPSYCASAIPELTRYGLDLKEASREKLAEFVNAFGSAARRCIEANFDLLEIHAGHGYLIETFLTPFYNRRTDEYGGTFENRIRFLLEIVREVMSVAEDRVPVGIRLNADDFIPKGSWGIEDLCRLAPILENEGLAYLHISCGTSTYGTIDQCIPPMYVEQGARAHYAQEVKKHVSLPVITVGRIKSPEVANSIIKEGKADLVAIARAFLADPEFLKKAREGCIDDIRPCLADCLGCIENILRYGETSCTVNPRVGREFLIKEIPNEKKNTPRKIVVAGSGPAGLEAARRAAFSGHEVVLCESRDELGGQLRMASSIPGRSEIGDILPWYERKLAQLEIEIRLNTEVDQRLLSDLSPDVLVVATGSLPLVSQSFVEGLENIENVEPLMADEVIGGDIFENRRIIIIGGSQIGLQLADYLVNRNNIVYLVEKQKKLALKMAQADRHYLLDRLKTNKNVTIIRNADKVEILPHDTISVITSEGRQEIPGIEIMVFAGERRPNRFLAEVAEKLGIETHIIGDANGVSAEGQGTIMAAIASGYDVGRQI